MINEETIVSVYNDKMTLLQFLKTVNKALDEAVLTSVEVNKKGNATLSFVFVFADGTKIESGEIVLQQGESVTDAKIVDGHLYLTLSNDERLDAGNVKPVTRFEINASQHLIVYYGDGTSQDLGAILQGNVNIDGNLTANSIIENMSGYIYEKENIGADLTPIFVSAVKNGNKLTCVWFLSLSATKTDYSAHSFGDITMPDNILIRLVPFSLSGIDNLLDVKVIPLYNEYNAKIDANLILQKYTHSITPKLYVKGLTIGTRYLLRYEVTMLLNDSLAV